MVTFKNFQSGRNAKKDLEGVAWSMEIIPNDPKKVAHPFSPVSHGVKDYLASYEVDRNSIFVGNLTEDVTRDELASLFHQFGSIQDIVINKRPSVIKGCNMNVFAYIQFSNAVLLKDAIETMHGRVRNGQRLKVLQKKSTEALYGGASEVARNNGTEVAGTDRVPVTPVTQSATRYLSPPGAPKKIPRLTLRPDTRGPPVFSLFPANTGGTAMMAPTVFPTASGHGGHVGYGGFGGFGGFGGYGGYGGYNGYAGYTGYVGYPTYPAYGGMYPYSPTYPPGQYGQVAPQPVQPVQPSQPVQLSGGAAVNVNYAFPWVAPPSGNSQLHATQFGATAANLSAASPSKDSFGHSEYFEELPTYTALDTTTATGTAASPQEAVSGSAAQDSTETTDAVDVTTSA